MAVFFQGVAIALAAFVAGGYISMIVTSLMSFSGNQLFWIFYIIGGVIGAVLLFLIFDWALILISSLSGASLIVQTVEFDQDIKTLLFIVLVIIGIIFQTVIFRQDPGNENGN